MDRKTADAIERLGGRIDHLDGRIAHLDARIDRLETSVRGEITSLRGEITALGERIEERHRHSHLLIESLRDDIRLLADGFAQLSTRMAGRS